MSREQSLPAQQTAGGSHARRNRANALSFLMLIGISMLVALPFLWMLSTSLKADVRSVYDLPPVWIPEAPAWRNFRTAWNSAHFDRYAINSVFVAVSATLLQVTNGCLAAYAFSRIRFYGREALFVVFLAAMMVPMQVTVLPNYVTLLRLGWLNSYWALIVPFAANAFGIFLIRQAFLGIPDDLVDASIVDGAGHLKVLRYVMIPLSKPMIITFALLTFTWRWSEYFWVIIMTTSDKIRTLPVGLVLMQAGPEGGTKWHIVMAATLIVLLPVLLLFGVAQRYFVQGVTHTGLRG